VDFNEGATATYPKVYVPNSNQGFDATQTSNSIASQASNKIYEGYKYFPVTNTELYFTQISSNTAPKFGDNGGDGTLETNGAKIVVPTAGLHYLKVNLNDKTYTIQRQDWVLIGSATGGQPIMLEWDATLGMLVATVNLSEGTFAFQASTDALVNLGDTNNDAILEANGGGIVIEKSGTYKVILDLDKPDYTYQLRLQSFDRRGAFFTEGQNRDINDLTLFTEGYAVNKFKNVTSTGQNGSDTDFPDTDFPMFRLADVYLMAAEAILRGAGGGDKAKAVEYANKVRERAYTGGAGNYTTETLTLDEILNERARELYWECHRRTDLVRFGQFTNGAYVWAWKGGVKEGRQTEAFRNLYPIPAADLGANTNLKQNPGY
jgi:hypothetical protein